MPKFRPTAGFSLVELAIVLMVVGLIAGAVFKGQNVLEAARMRAVVSDFQRYKMAFDAYQELYGTLPGDDDQAATRFGTGINNGNGNGIVDPSESINVWPHLNKAGQINSSIVPTSKMGGKFTFVYNYSPLFPGHWLMLGKENGSTNNGALFTPQQAHHLKNKIDDPNTPPQEGQLRFAEGAGISNDQCIKNGRFNLEVKSPSCIALMGG